MAALHWGGGKSEQLFVNRNPVDRPVNLNPVNMRAARAYLARPDFFPARRQYFHAARRLYFERLKTRIIVRFLRLQIAMNACYF